VRRVLETGPPWSLELALWVELVAFGELAASLVLALWVELVLWPELELALWRVHARVVQVPVAGAVALEAAPTVVVQEAAPSFVWWEAAPRVVSPALPLRWERRHQIYRSV
jgi:hypothetical protein